MPRQHAASRLGIGLWLQAVVAISASTCKVLESFHDTESADPDWVCMERSLIQTRSLRARLQDIRDGVDGFLEDSTSKLRKPHGRRKRVREGDAKGDDAGEGREERETWKEKHQRNWKRAKDRVGAIAHPTWENATVLGVGFASVFIMIAVRFFLYDSRRKAWFVGASSDAMLEKERENEVLPSDTYTLAIFSLIYDSHTSAAGSLHICRIAQSAFLVCILIGIQLFVLAGIKIWACSKAVNDIRRVYDAFEVHMYGPERKHTTLDMHGDHRGRPAFFNSSNFDSLPASLKDEVCSIPFSQPPFFIVTLCIWTLTCFSEVKTCVELFYSLILRTPRLKSMRDALSPENENRRQVVQGLTTMVKTVICVCILIPRAGITFLLLWLGCRWLAATNNFMDLILNAVALEFILLMKDMVYGTLVPEWNKHDVERIEIAPPTRLEQPGHWALLGTVQWGALALVWVLIYVFSLQSVLPDYRWDVREVCNNWVRAQYGFSMI